MNLKSINYFALLFCFTTFAAASNEVSDNEFYSKHTLPDRDKIYAIFSKWLPKKEISMAHKIADQIAGQLRSQNDVYQALHMAGGYGTQEIFIGRYGKAAEEVMIAAQKK